MKSMCVQNENTKECIHTNRVTHKHAHAHTKTFTHMPSKRATITSKFPILSTYGNKITIVLINNKLSPFF